MFRFPWLRLRVQQEYVISGEYDYSRRFILFTDSSVVIYVIRADVPQSKKKKKKITASVFKQDPNI